jgi:hypothetical protein
MEDEGRITHALNCSKAKAKFSFGKSSRFRQAPLPNHITQYEVEDKWIKFKNRPINKEFTKTVRFKYYADTKRHAKEHPSPSQYNVKGQFG